MGTVPIFVQRKWDCPLRKYEFRALQVQARRDDVNSLPRHAEILGHEVGIVTIHGHQGGQIGGRLAQRDSGSVVVRLRQPLQERVFAGKRTYHRHAQPPADLPGHAAKQHVGEMDQFGPDVALEPIEQLFQFLSLTAVFAAEHGDGHRAQVFR